LPARVDYETQEKLKEIAEQKGCSLSGLVREILEEYIKEKKPALNRQIFNI
jgi:predicted DNA-binding protein